SALQDSGAEGILLNYRFARLHNLTRTRLGRPIPVRNVDGSDNEFFIADIGEHDLILGTDWLAMHNPEVDWKQSRVDMTRCPPSC
ncbi:hypothetical protein PENSPDRAFT_552037, partial [Peniophora sp. CONT]